METVNVKEFVKNISKSTGYTQKDITAVLESAEAVMTSILNDGKGVKLFKSLSVVPITVGARKVKTPVGTIVDVPDRVIPKARFSQALKDFLNNK